MKRLLYIYVLAALVYGCTRESFDVNSAAPTDDPKVEVNFTVQVKDPSVVTKTLGQQPKLRNLMVAVFDASGYLMEYT